MGPKIRSLDERQEVVLADIEPLAVPFDLLSGDLAVGPAVVAGHVDVLLAGSPVHGERLVS